MSHSSPGILERAGTACAKAVPPSIHLAGFCFALLFSPLAGSGADDFPILTAAIGTRVAAPDVANKGLAIQLDHDAAVCFDTDLLRMSAGWVAPQDWTNSAAKVSKELQNTYPGWGGRLLTLHGVTFDGSHGGHPTIFGDIVFRASALPGWADAKGEFKDARTEPFGPIAPQHARWDGYYVHGKTVVLAYTVHGTKIYEQPSTIRNGDEVAFVRTLRIETPKIALTMLVAEEMGNRQARLSQAPPGVRLENPNGGRVVLHIPKGAPASTFSVVIGAGEGVGLVDFKSGSPAHWPETVQTRGTLETSKTPDGSYVVDQLMPPVDNPWKRRVRFGGMDFFADGKRAALSTWDGDVWIVSGIDDKLEQLTWRRFAAGGFETLGLKIVDDVIYTSGRDQITRYHDLNGDGEADYYENFNNEITSSCGFHEFVFDLHTDRQGNFYTIKAGPVRGGGSGFGGGGGNGFVSAYAGTLMKVSRDGSKREVFATGFRAQMAWGWAPMEKSPQAITKARGCRPARSIGSSLAASAAWKTPLITRLCRHSRCLCAGCPRVSITPAARKYGSQATSGARFLASCCTFPTANAAFTSPSNKTSTARCKVASCRFPSGSVPPRCARVLILWTANFTSPVYAVGRRMPPTLRDSTACVIPARPFIP